jgi:hypothetical protein
MVAALAASVLLSWAGVAAAVPASAVVWGRGSSEGEAKAALRNLQELHAAVNELLAVPKGFPRIVDDPALPGSAKGSWVVVLGFCKSETADRLVELLRPLSSEAKALATEVPALACPRLSQEWHLGARAKVAAGSENSLSAQLFEVAAESGERASEGFVAVWLSRGAEVLEARALPSLRCTSVEVLRLDKRRLRVKASCVTDSCAQDEISEIFWTLEANQAIEITRRDGEVLQKRECD